MTDLSPESQGIEGAKTLFKEYLKGAEHGNQRVNAARDIVEFRQADNDVEDCLAMNNHPEVRRDSKKLREWESLLRRSEVSKALIRERIQVRKSDEAYFSSREVLKDTITTVGEKEGTDALESVLRDYKFTSEF